VQRVPKETSHRGDELKGLGWSEADVFRYVELWEYRQRWGAMNLERKIACFCGKQKTHSQKFFLGERLPKSP